MEMAVQGGRKGRLEVAAGQRLEIGVCGETGGEPASVMMYHKAELDYVSCSPFRVPVARIAAAHATILQKRGKL